MDRIYERVTEHDELLHQVVDALSSIKNNRMLVRTNIIISENRNFW